MIIWLLSSVICGNFDARIMEQGSGALAFLFHHEEHVEDGALHTRDTYLYPTLAAAKADGLKDREASVEEVVVHDGKLVLYTLDQRQREQQGTIEIDDSNVYYTWVSQGKRKTGQAKLGDNFAVPTTVTAIVGASWPTIAANKMVTARLAVVSELSDFGFELEPDSAASTSAYTQIRVKPTSPIIALFAPKLFLRVDAKSGKPFAYHGPLDVFRRTGKDWKALFADVVVVAD